MKREIHPAAELFPLMDDVALDDLAADIAEHGLRDPILTIDGAILDGRNRLAACERAGVVPEIREWDGNGSPVDFVLSANLHRRHLTAAQRAFIATEVRSLYLDEARQAQAHGETAPGRTLSAPVHKAMPVETAQRAADRLGVSRRSVYYAEQIKKHAPDLVEHVIDGSLALRTAGHEAAQRAEPRPTLTLVEPQTGRQKNLAEAAKLRVQKAVGTFNGLARGLKELNVAGAASVSTTKEIAQWEAACTEAIAAINVLRKRIKECS